MKKAFLYLAALLLFAPQLAPTASLAAAKTKAPCEAKTLSLGGNTSETGEIVDLTWTGQVRNNAAKALSVAVEITCTDKRGEKTLILSVPAIAVEAGGRKKEEAVFQVDPVLWGKVYTCRERASCAGDGR